MWYSWLRVSALFLLIAVALADFSAATPIASWENKLVKHALDGVPPDWESLGHPSAGTVIDLHFALQPEQEGALTDALYEVSDPERARRVILTTPPLAPLFTCAAASFQIWRIPS